MLSTESPLTALRDFDRVLDCPRTRHYTRLLDDIVSARLEHFDLDALPWGEVGDAKHLQGHQQGWRGATNLTGLLAFCHANPLSRHHGDARLLAHVKARLLEFARTQQEGMILSADMLAAQVDAEQPIADAELRRNNLYLAWSIEPLAMAANWVRDDLDAGQTTIVRRMIRRSADLLMALPCDERNNRGAVRCAVLCLLGRYLEDETLVQAGIRDFHRAPLGIFNPDGQINEGPGPDANYSGTSFIYCYTYRLFSDDIGIEAGIRDGARWYSWIADSFGAPACMGACTRVAIANPAKVTDFLPAMERHADAHPHFNWAIENGYLRSVGPASPLHAVSPLIYAMFEHNGKPGVEDPDWFSPARLHRYKPGVGPEFRFNDEGTDSHYFVLRRRGNFAVTSLIGRFPYKGLQTWNYALEAPVIWPTVTHASKTRAFGVDTARMRVSGTKFEDRHWHEGRDGRPNVLVTRTEEVMNHYVQTATTLLYLVSCHLTPREDRFIIDPKRCGEPRLDAGMLRYEDRQGRMVFAGPQPEVTRRENGIQLCFRDMGRTALYAFSNASFELLEFAPDGDCIRFRDDTGRYELHYEIRVFANDDLAPIGDKGLGRLFLSPQVHVRVDLE